MLITILIIVAVLIAALLIFTALRPNTFRITRSISIRASAEKIFASINDFHKWCEWSPWEKMDPAMKRSFSGSESGKGTIYEWEGNKKVGKGRMKITQSQEPSKIIIKLDFFSPFEAHNTAEFILEPKGEITRVNWDMYGPRPFVSKLMGIFFNMDKMIGKDFEAGLANLKAVSEK